VINAPSIPKYPVVVNEMMSYFDLYTLLDDMLTNSPFTASTTPLSSRIQKLAGTQFVSESASATIMQTNDQRFWVRPSGSNTWVQY
ncbi:cellulose biosynthesis protein BcsG, partial [Escherichia coli]